MKRIDEKKNKAVIKPIEVISLDEEGKKRVVKREVKTHKVDTVKYVEKKLMDKGVHRMERHPADGIGIRPPPPKSGHGGKYTWEGPDDLAENELNAPIAIDEKDPNYVDEEEKDGGDEEEELMVKGEVDVPKAVEDVEGVGVARVEVNPHLKVN